MLISIFIVMRSGATKLDGSSLLEIRLVEVQ